MAEPLGFPLLAGNPDPCLRDGKNYPLTVLLDGVPEYLFAKGVAPASALMAMAAETARLLSVRYAGRRLLLVEVREGGGIFAGLVHRQLAGLGAETGLRAEPGNIKVRSYGQGSRATAPRVVKPLCDARGRELADCSKFDAVVLLDDLIDAGHTAIWLAETYLPRFAAREVAVCTMLDKERPRGREVEAALCRIVLSSGLRVADDWLVGYGLDMTVPGGGATPDLHLFRPPLPGGVYAFNTALEPRLTAAYQADPQGLRRQLASYVSAE